MAILFGKAKIGKTTALMNLACCMMLQGFRIHYYTLEMAPDYLILRTLSAYDKVPTFSLKDKKRAVQVKNRMKKDYPNHGDITFYEYPSGKLSCDMIVQNIMHHSQKGRRIDVVFVDYVDIMKQADARNEWTSMSINTQELRALAVEHGCCCITASQFGKAGLDREELGGADVYGSVAKIFMADVVGFINRRTFQVRTRGGYDEEQEETSFTLGYARYGKSGTRIILDSDRDTGRIFPLRPEGN